MLKNTLFRKKIFWTKIEKKTKFNITKEISMI